MKTDEDWKKILDPEEYRICREKGTEPPFSGIYWDHKDEGIYRCKCCDTPLFASDGKYDSGCGWPSFDRAFDEQAIEYREDRSHGMIRTEILCRNCGCHLGHVFDDGPAETTGRRFCVNSASIRFEDQE